MGVYIILTANQNIMLAIQFEIWQEYVATHKFQSKLFPDVSVMMEPLINDSLRMGQPLKKGHYSTRSLFYNISTF